MVIKSGVHALDIGGGRGVKDEFLYGINWGVVGERKLLLEVDRLGVVHTRLLYIITIRRKFGPNNETAFRVVQEISNDFVVKRGGVGGVVMMAFRNLLDRAMAKYSAIVCAWRYPRCSTDPSFQPWYR